MDIVHRLKIVCMCRDGIGQHRLFRYFMYDRSIDKDIRHAHANVTVDVDYITKMIDIDGKGNKAHLQIYHFPTSAEDNDLRERVDHYPLIDSCDGIILMFSLVNRESYEAMQQLYRFLIFRQNNFLHQELKKSSSGNTGDVLGSPSRARGTTMIKSSSSAHSRHAYKGSVSAFFEGLPLSKPLVVVGLDAEKCEAPKFVTKQLNTRNVFLGQLLELLERFFVPNGVAVSVCIIEYLDFTSVDAALGLDPQLERARLTYTGSERSVWYEEVHGQIRDWSGQDKKQLKHSHSNPPSLKYRESTVQNDIFTLEQLVADANLNPNRVDRGATISSARRTVPNQQSTTVDGVTTGFRVGHFSYVEVSATEGYNYARGFIEMAEIVIDMKKSTQQSSSRKQHQSGKSCFVQ